MSLGTEAAGRGGPSGTREGPGASRISLAAAIAVACCGGPVWTLAVDGRAAGAARACTCVAAVGAASWPRRQRTTPAAAATATRATRATRAADSTLGRVARAEGAWESEPV